MSKSSLAITLKRKMLSSFCMGFSSGVPLLLISTIVQAWLKESGVDIKTIGLMALMGLPYSVKYLWAPWLDSYDPPAPLNALGRRRGWMLLSQMGVIAFLLCFAFTDPLNINLVAINALLLCFCSATQDIIVDAYRREDLADKELGLGSAYYQWGYRLGMMAVGGGGLILADLLSWPQVFMLMSLLMIIGPLSILFSPEPLVDRPQKPAGFIHTVGAPLKDFFQRPSCWMILLFIFFYKFGDQLASSLNTVYFLTLGYSKTDIGGVVKIFGVGATLAGVMLGGCFILKHGIKNSLWIFGILQMISTIGFAVLYYLPVNYASLAFVVAQENLASGAGSSAFVAFMAAQTNRSFSATQYALLSSMMALPRTVLSSPAGYLADFLGWPVFFALSTALALPGLIILQRLTKRDVFSFDPQQPPQK